MKPNQNRFIEKYLPIAELGTYAAKEGNIGTGRIANIHRYWARRREGLSRALIFASLIPWDEDFKENSELIKKLGKWDVDESIINLAKEKLKKSYPNKKMKFWDPFSGGGALPLEALELGLDIYASDLNNLSCLILKATIEYPTKFFSNSKKKGELDKFVRKEIDEPDSENQRSLGDLIRTWGKWVADNAKPEIDDLFPVNNHSEIPALYFWVHKIECSNPSCKRQMPLSKMNVIFKDKDGFVGLSFIPNKENGTFHTIVEKVKNHPEEQKLTGSQGVTTCIFCGMNTSGEKIRELAQEGKMDFQLAAKMYLENNGKSQKKIFKEIEHVDEEKVHYSNQLENGLNVNFPPVPEYNGKGIQRYIGLPRLYGVNNFREFFIPRQVLVISVINKWILKAITEIQKHSTKETADIISLYLSFALDKFIEFSSRFNFWKVDGYPIQVAPSYAYIFAWDFIEIYPFKDGGYSFNSKIDDIAEAIDNISKIPPQEINIFQHNASEKSFLDDSSIDLIVTDPPYYDTIAYAGLSDFFYGLLKQVHENTFPEFFKDVVIPKSQECILQRHKYEKPEDAVLAYQNQLKNAFREMNRVLIDNGILVVIFAHTDLSAWIALINALIEANFQVIACWPINTEKSQGVTQGDAAILKTTMHFVCRKKEKVAITTSIFFQDLQNDTEDLIQKKFEIYWRQGFSGGNLDVAMFGPSLEIYGKYLVIEDEKTGEKITVDRWLDFTQKLVLQLQLRQIMKESLSNAEKIHIKTIDTFTQFYLLFRFEFGVKDVELDAVRLLEKATSLEVKNLIKWGYMEKKGSKIVLLNADERKKPEDLINHKPQSEIITSIDMLHGAVIAQQRGLFKEYIVSGLIDHQNPIWIIAQLLANILPESSKEAASMKNLLNLRKIETQETLDNFTK